MAPNSAQNGNFDAALNLLEKATSIRVVGDFLKKRGLSHSAGSWENMRKMRLLPAIQDGKLTIQDIMALIGEAEEYGRSHVFLYTCERKFAQQLLDETCVAPKAKQKKLNLGEAQVIDQPAQPTIAEIRLGGDGKARSLVIKVIEVRKEFILESTDEAGGFLTKRWKVLKSRAVNVVRLSPSGLLEIRIQSHNNSGKYEEDIDRLFSLVADFVPRLSFKARSISKAKTKLMTEREDYSEIVRFCDSELRNDEGIVIRAATGKLTDNLNQNRGATESIDAFMGCGGFCNSANVWFLKQDDGIPDDEIHVLLSGAANEFAVTANCSKSDYEYVLETIQKLC